MVRRFLQSLGTDSDFTGTVRHSVFLPPRNACFGTLKRPLPTALYKGLKVLDVGRLYSHQTDAIEAVRSGRNVVVVTPTASGKTLSYFLPIMEALLSDPDGSALLLFPLKALEQDQRQKIEQWQKLLEPEFQLKADVFDGDTPRAARARIKRNPPHMLISNPDMLHQGILAYHQGWEAFLKRLRWIVIDELHAYRGVFGSHILQVFRRLSRMLSYHGSNPQFICLSATIANPLELAETLTGNPFSLIGESGAPHGGRYLVFIDPKASMTSAVAKLFIKALDAGLRTIAFTKARVTTEVIHRVIMETRPDLAPRISSYRAGFLPEERRDIENKMSSGELLGVISTSALELGIDIGGLDVCILAGYPGSIMSLWQRAGRVGRRGDESAVLLVAGYDALDQYFLAYPDQLLERAFETALVNCGNEEILRAHLPAAAAEIPLMTSDPFIRVSEHEKVIAELEHEGALLKSASGQHWFAGSRRPHARVNLRNVGGSFDVYSASNRKPMGEISGGAVFRECHEGAIYLHRGEQFLVEELDLDKKRVRVKPVNATYYTMVRSDKQTEIIDDRLCRNVQSLAVHAGKVKVTETFHSFERRRIYSQELLSVEPLDLPPQSYVTSSAWIEIPTSIGDALAKADLHFMGGIHAVEHAAISLIPLFALCDRNDVGGISFTRHPQLAGGAVFFYDGYPGGVGIAEHVYDTIEDLLRKTLDRIAHCPCADGCPSCIQSPKCGAGNKPLDKRASVFVLESLLKTPEEPLPEIEAVRKVARDELQITPSMWTPQHLPADKRVLVLDIETQRSAEEVGGWNEARQMRVAVVAVWDSLTNEIITYDEAGVDALLEHMKSADLIVGFNIRRFDYEVLRGYTFENLNRLPTLDLLNVVERSLGRRLKLDSLTTATLNAAKSADGLQSLAWFKAGEIEKVAEYCRHDVEITRDLLFFALEHGYLLFGQANGEAARVPMPIELSEYFDSASSATETTKTY